MLHQSKLERVFLLFFDSSFVKSGWKKGLHYSCRSFIMVICSFLLYFHSSKRYFQILFIHIIGPVQVVHTRGYLKCYAHFHLRLEYATWEWVIIAFITYWLSFLLTRGSVWLDCTLFVKIYSSPNSFVANSNWITSTACASKKFLMFRWEVVFLVLLWHTSDFCGFMA